MADLLHIMTEMKLPSPCALRLTFDNSGQFRGTAFATFLSSNEAWDVIQALNYCRVPGGGRLNVQYEEEGRETVVTEAVIRGEFKHSKRHPQIGAHDQERKHRKAEVPSTRSSAPRRTREQTPPSESYDLLMSYQESPREKEKLKRFLAETGDYQEAINEFSKNRARETLAGEHGRHYQGEHGGEHGRQYQGEHGGERRGERRKRKGKGSRPVLETRSAKSEDEQRIAAMERQTPMVKQEMGEEVASKTTDGLPESSKLELVEKKRKVTFAEQGAELDTGKHEEGSGKEDKDPGADKHGGATARVDTEQPQPEK